MKGRKPKPTHLRVVEGNPGRRPLNRKEPVPRGDLSDPPEWMSDSQRAGWNYAIEHAPKGLLKKHDASVLTVWVVAEDLHRQATRALAKCRLSTKQPRAGEPMQRPYRPIINRRAQMMMKAAAELGFTPSSRSRVEVDAHDGQEDPAGAFFERRSS